MDTPRPSPAGPLPDEPAQPLAERHFHPGEQALQQQMGSRERLARMGDQRIQPSLDQARQEFFAALPWLLLGGVDGAGQPWASVLAGAPGFIQTDAQHLDIHARLADDDPLAPCLVPGAGVGLLGLMPAQRRRNRVNGQLIPLADGGSGYRVAVHQSFGNCPKYIQPRCPVLQPELPPPGPLERGDGLLPAVAALLARSDTLFIASTTPARLEHPARGVDVSHRGGAPGFVDQDGPRLWLPDYPGNQYFNTLGNLHLHPRAGLLLVDFEEGALGWLACRCTALRPGEGLALVVEHSAWRPHGLALGWENGASAR